MRRCSRGRRPVPELSPLARKVDDTRRRQARLQHLAACTRLLAHVQAAYDEAFTGAVRACSLAEVARVTGLTRAGVQHHRRRLRGTTTTTREATK